MPGKKRGRVDSKKFGYLIIDGIGTKKLSEGDKLSLNGNIFKVVSVTADLILEHIRKDNDKEKSADKERNDVQRRIKAYNRDISDLVTDYQNFLQNMGQNPSRDEQVRIAEDMDRYHQLINKQKEELGKLHANKNMDVWYVEVNTTITIRLTAGQRKCITLPNSRVALFMTWTWTGTGCDRDPVSTTVQTTKKYAEVPRFPEIDGNFKDLTVQWSGNSPPNFANVVASSSSPDGTIFIATKDNIYAATPSGSVAVLFVNVDLVDVHVNSPCTIKMICVQGNRLFILDEEGPTVWVYKLDDRKLSYIRNWAIVQQEKKECHSDESDSEEEYSDVHGLAVSSKYVFISDSGAACIYVYYFSGEMARKICGDDSDVPRLFDDLRGLGTTEEGNFLVCSPGGKFVEMFTSDGDSLGVFQLPDTIRRRMQPFAPSDVVVNGEQVIVADQDNRTIWVFDLEGNLTGEWSTTRNGVQTTGPTAMTMVDGRLWVVVGDGFRVHPVACVDCQSENDP